MQQYCEISTPKGVMRGFMHIPQVKNYPLCLIFHGFTGNKTGTKFSYVELSRRLEQNGIGSLRMDFLGSGESDLSFKDMTFDDELSCARLLIEEVMKMKQVSEIYVLGHSMGGAIASELAKIYPNVIKKLCLWAPAYNLPDVMKSMSKVVQRAEYYDHHGFQISDVFVEDIMKRDLYEGLDCYNHDLMVIHGDKDMTVPYAISEKYLPLMNHPQFITIKGGTHNFDTLKDIEEVLNLSFKFLSGEK